MGATSDRYHRPVGPVSFTTLPFTGSDKNAGRLATALTDAGIKVVSITSGSGLLIRSNDVGRARVVLERFEEAESKTEAPCFNDNNEDQR